jgi:hypothetical protein
MADSVDIKTYDDEAFYGKLAPSLELLDFVRGEKIDYRPGQVQVLYFFNTFYKGAWWCNEEVTKLAEKFHPLGVQFVAVSQDADVASLERFLGKIADAKIVDENTKEPLRLTLPYTAFDDKKFTGKMFAVAFDHTVLHVPQAVIVDGKGQIAWRQAFSQSHLPSQSNFAAQLERVMKGEPVERVNGNLPKMQAAADEGSDCEVEGDMALF